jgi:hypothetical protein
MLEGLLLRDDLLLADLARKLLDIKIWLGQIAELCSRTA